MVSLLLILALAAAAPQLPPPPPTQPPVPPRDVRPPAREATGVIRGRVIEQDTGRPIARATVTLMSGALRRQPGEEPVATVSDENGRYEFTGLPAGDYIVTARPREFRPTHLAQTFGDDRPAQAARARRPRPLKLADGEVREEANIALWRTYAIEGRVVDEFGEPVAGVNLRPRAAETGRNIPMMGPFMFATDDRGAYRIYGLGPGSYTICATPRQFGPPTGGMRERYVETCHPAAVSEGDAQQVAVIASDVSGVDIRLQRSRAYTVSGMAFDSSGAPLARAQINLMRMGRDGASGTGLEIRSDGGFIARGLTPGDYAIRADTRPRFGPPDAAAPEPDREVAYLPFRVENSDIEGLVVVTRRPTTVTGRVVFGDGATAPEGVAGMRVTANTSGPSGQIGMMGPPPSAQVQSDLTFELGGLFGPAVIALAGAPPNWIVESVRYRAQDITATPVDFAGARDGDRLEIVLTNRGARVSGTVIDGNAQPVDAFIWMLPADPARWTLHSVVRGGTAPDAQGSFKIGPARAGEYLIAALDPEDGPRVMPDLNYFERVAAVAERITLVESEDRVLQLQLRKLQ